MRAGGRDEQAAKTIKVEQIGSPIRREHTQRETLIGLGLNKIGRIARAARHAGDARHDRQGQHLVRVVETSNVTDETRPRTLR